LPSTDDQDIERRETDEFTSPGHTIKKPMSIPHTSNDDYLKLDDSTYEGGFGINQSQSSGLSEEADYKLDLRKVKSEVKAIK